MFTRFIFGISRKAGEAPAQKFTLIIYTKLQKCKNLKTKMLKFNKSELKLRHSLNLQETVDLDGQLPFQFENL
jgi:hypothetical protein